MSYIRSFFQNLVCVILAGVVAYYLSVFTGSLYCNRVGNCSAGIASVDFTAVMGLLLGYFLFVPIFLALFGAKGKNWWIAVLTLPIFTWTIYMDIRLMQLMPLVLSAVAGFLLGTIAHKTLQKLAPAFMAKIS